jgi:hypothetical protein
VLPRPCWKELRDTKNDLEELKRERKKGKKMSGQEIVVNEYSDEDYVPKLMLDRFIEIPSTDKFVKEFFFFFFFFFFLISSAGFV